MQVGWCLALFLPLVVQSQAIVEVSLPVDCEDVFQNQSMHSGVYTIYPFGEATPMEVYCDMGCTKNNDNDHDGGQWTVIQKRMDGTTNFYRPWDHYKEGFGNKSGEYWLGLQNIFLLTWSAKYELRVDLEDFEGGAVHALYRSFSIESELDGYKLHIDDFINGGAGDSLSTSNGQKFSTFDKDQDSNHFNCAKDFHKGGFWINQCRYNHYGWYYYTKIDVNLNGQYRWQSNHIGDSSGLIWKGWRGDSYSLKAVTMKIKRVPWREVSNI